MTEFRTALRRVKLKGGADVTVMRPNDAAKITQQMRNLATAIDRGIIRADTVITLVSTHGETIQYHWGNFDRARAAGMMLSAANSMARSMEE